MYPISNYINAASATWGQATYLGKKKGLFSNLMIYNSKNTIPFFSQKHGGFCLLHKMLGVNLLDDTLSGIVVFIFLASSEPLHVLIGKVQWEYTAHQSLEI